MPIPDFQTLMRPVLELHADGAEHNRSDQNRLLADRFGLSPEERAITLASGRQKRFDNRVGWAITYLFQSGLLSRPRRGVTQLTERGREVLDAHPNRVDMRVLSQFEEYQRFRSRSDVEPAADTVAEPTEATPEESIDQGYEQLRTALAEELRARLFSASPAFFEQGVVDVLVAMGYGGGRREAGERLGQSGDEGIDGVIREDVLGLDAIYVQAKKWDPNRPVGRPEIQAFVGALHGARASKGVFMTTSRFTEEAKQYASSVTPRVVLIDGRRLAELMIDHSVGVSTQQVYELKRIDEDYFQRRRALAIRCRSPAGPSNEAETSDASARGD